MNAIFSQCGKYRYRLDRDIQPTGKLFAYFGINPSTASATVDDHTTRKWSGFTKANGGRAYIAANPFAYCATEVSELAAVDDPVGPDNRLHLQDILAVADVLVPCWGVSSKIPRKLRCHLDDLRSMLRSSGKPVMTLGLTKSGDPMRDTAQRPRSIASIAF